jgi:DNA-directed RNA polymerase subunit RPC12/RpoP
LYEWKKQHEAWVEAGGLTHQSAAREITVTGGGLGGLIDNQGPGIGLEVQGAPGQTAERIEVVGRGIGEIVTNTGPGTGKVVRSIGAPASESRVTVNQPVKMAAGLISKVAIVVCDSCRTQFSASKLVQGFAGDEEPKVQITCPYCGHPSGL